MPQGPRRVATKTFSDKHKELFPYLAQAMGDTAIAKELGITSMSVHQRIERMMDIAKSTGRADLEAFCRAELAKEHPQEGETECISWEQFTQEMKGEVQP